MPIVIQLVQNPTQPTPKAFAGTPAGTQPNSRQPWKVSYINCLMALSAQTGYIMP